MPPTTRKKAAEAAHKLLSANIVLIEELADADAAIDALEAEQRALNDRVAAARDTFKERYRAALQSWTDGQLADLGYRPARGGTPVQRGRRRAATTPVAATSPAPATPRPDEDTSESMPTLPVSADT